MNLITCKLYQNSSEQVELLIMLPDMDEVKHHHIDSISFTIETGGQKGRVMWILTNQQGV